MNIKNWEQNLQLRSQNLTSLYPNNSELYISFQWKNIEQFQSQDFVFFIFRIGNWRYNFLFLNFELVNQKWKNKSLKYLSS